MKKYLIKGALALFAGTLVFSCSEKESEYIPLAQQKVNAFEDVFKQVYGDIDPYQDWGFSQGAVNVDPNDSTQVVEVIDLDGDVAYTRAAAFGNYDVLLAFNGKTRSANTEHNLWGDPNYYNLNVPPALTEGQKERVRLYFQNNPNLTYVDPHYTNFFVQQVYKGYTNTSGSQSAEIYDAGNNTTVIGSNHMDKLTVGFPANGGESSHYYHHVNDFNYGTYNGGSATLVLNTGASTNDFSSQSHPDQITYMVNSKTDCVGYWSSDGSTGHNDRCALVSAAVIDDWARKNGYPGESVTDGWNRSFVGLDYDQKSAEQVYVKDWNKNDGSYMAATVGNAPQKEYVWTGTSLVRWDDVKNQVLKDKNNKTVYFVTDQTNMILATNADYSSQSDVIKRMTKDECSRYGVSIQNDDVEVVDLTKIQAKINDGCLPVVNGMYQKWVKNVGGRDYYYSDWIVTLTPAGNAPQPRYEYPVQSIDEWTQIERGRVFCEDLGQASREDLDYNDVVFDAIVFKNYTKYTKWEKKYVDNVLVSEKIIEGPTEATKYYANVEILAAGGTIPITVADYQVHDQFNPKAAVNVMINTRDNNSSAYGGYDVRNPAQIGTETRNFQAVVNDNGDKQTFNLKLFEIEKPANNEFIKSIKIVSSFDGQQVSELKSDKGGAPQKFLAPIGTRWTSERKNISLAYPLFDAWVKGGAAPWGTVNYDYIYDQTLHSNSVKLPLVMKAQKTIITEGEQNLWTGSKQYGADWNLADMNATLDLDKFYPGDRLRFYGTGIGDEAWITVIIGSIKPYFVDSNFPNYVINPDGTKVSKTSGCVEVFLDESAANLLNAQMSGGKVTFQVQGRNFTLTRICRVLF